MAGMGSKNLLFERFLFLRLTCITKLLLLCVLILTLRVGVCKISLKVIVLHVLAKFPHGHSKPPIVAFVP